MHNRRTLLLLGGGVVLGLGLAAGGELVSAESREDSCSVSRSAGSLRAVTAEGWLVFEDEQGAVRMVDSRCKVKRVIDRR